MKKIIKILPLLLLLVTAVLLTQTVILTAKASDADAKTTALNALGAMQSSKFLNINARGNCIAKKGLITYRQDVTGSLMKRSGMQYTRASTHSKFVNLTHEATISGNNVVYTHNGKRYNATLDEYSRLYGSPQSTPDGHIITDRTVLNARYTDSSPSSTTVEMVLDSRSACTALSSRMKTIANLSQPPQFTENPTVTLKVNANGKPIYMKTVDCYTVNIPVLGSVNCVQTLELFIIM